MKTGMPHRATLRPLLAALAAACALPALAGCAIVGFAGTVAHDIKERKPVDVEAEYDGIAGHSFALVIAADRVTQADFPYLLPRLTAGINEKLAAEAGATGYVPTNALLAYLYEHPNWVARPPDELADDLGVERLIVIDILEYRLHEPGNRYLWDGSVVASVGVVEADGPIPAEYVFEHTVSVTFPDGTGYGLTDYSRELVERVLHERFVNRAAWLFYHHQEPGNIPY